MPYQKLIDPKEGEPVAIAGDQLRLVILREGKKIELRPLLGPRELPQPDGQSPRYSGFARAYNVTVDAKSPLGGPVIDRTGRVVGVAIAWAGSRMASCCLWRPTSTIAEGLERDQPQRPGGGG